MAAGLNNAKDIIFQKWNQRANNPNALASIHQDIESIKLQLYGITPSDADVASLIHVRELLELGAFLAIEAQQIDAFERYLAHLKIHYFDYKDVPGYGESANKFLLLGLNLIRLLSQNRLAEFHIELELLPPDVIQSNPYINHPVLLEQYLMEGSYNKVFLAKNQIPSPYYMLFIDVLLNTIRIEIASCLEAAFDSVRIVDAARLLFLNNADDLKNFCSGRQWIMDGNGKSISFNKPQIADVLTAKVASKQIASQIIEYALELEKIV